MSSTPEKDVPPTTMIGMRSIGFFAAAIVLNLILAGGLIVALNDANKIQDEMDALKEQASRQREAARSAESEIIKTQTAINAIQSEKSKAASELASLETELVAARKIIAEGTVISKVMEGMTSQTKDADIRYANLVEKYAAMQIQHAKLGSDIEGRQKRLAELTSQHSTLEGNCNQLESESTKLKEDIAKAKVALAEANASLTKALAQKQDALKPSAEAQSMVDRLNARLNEIRGEITQEETRRNALAKDIGALNASLRNLQEARATTDMLKAQEQALREEIKRLESSVSALKK